MGLAGWHPSQCDPLRPSPAPTPALHLPLLHVAGLLGLKLFPGWSPTGPQLGWEGVLGSACPDLRRRDLLPRWRVYLRGMSCSWAWPVCPRNPRELAATPAPVSPREPQELAHSPPAPGLSIPEAIKGWLRPCPPRLCLPGAPKSWLGALGLCLQGPPWFWLAPRPAPHG